MLHIVGQSRGGVKPRVRVLQEVLVVPDTMWCPTGRMGHVQSMDRLARQKSRWSPHRLLSHGDDRESHFELMSTAADYIGP